MRIWRSSGWKSTSCVNLVINMILALGPDANRTLLATLLAYQPTTFSLSKITWLLLAGSYHHRVQAEPKKKKKENRGNLVCVGEKGESSISSTSSRTEGTSSTMATRPWVVAVWSYKQHPLMVVSSLLLVLMLLLTCGRWQRRLLPTLTARMCANGCTYFKSNNYNDHKH